LHGGFAQPDPDGSTSASSSSRDTLRVDHIELGAPSK
jgi:hypothetical protein